jgi:hypothetical protein
MAFIGANTAELTIPTPAAWSNSTDYTVGAPTVPTVVSSGGSYWVAIKKSGPNTTETINNVSVTVGAQTPAKNSPYWNPYTDLLWVTSGKTLTTASLPTLTHDKFTGSFFSNDTSSGSKLVVQQSGDNINWDVSSADITSASMTIGGVSGYGGNFSTEVLLPYIRLVFTYADTNPPTTLRLFGRTADSGVKY